MGKQLPLYLMSINVEGFILTPTVNVVRFAKNWQGIIPSLFEKHSNFPCLNPTLSSSQIDNSDKKAFWTWETFCN